MIPTVMHWFKEFVMLDANLASSGMAHSAFCTDRRIKAVLCMQNADTIADLKIRIHWEKPPRWMRIWTEASSPSGSM